MISIQTEDFDLAHEYQQLRQLSHDAGAIVSFTGLVREMYQAGDNEQGKVATLTLEHYPGMTEKALQEIVAQAQARWELLGVRVIHRIGELSPADQIVMVATASSHRHDAFDAAQFIMDYLKSKAPFWKKQATSTGSHWVDSRESDSNAIARWQQDKPAS